MAATPASTTTPYCSITQMLQFHDYEQVADLLRDGQNERPTRGTVNNNLSAEGAILYQMLLATAGEIESAAFIGQRYVLADLQALVTATPASAGYVFLQKLNADLAFWRLSQRRQPNSSDPARVPGAMQAVESLTQLRDGVRIFPFLETELAGLPVAVDPTVGGTGRIGGGRTSRIFGSHGGYSSNRGSD